MYSSVNVRCSSELGWPLVLAKDIHGHDHVKFEGDDDFFAVWQKSVSTDGMIVLRGCYMKQDTEETITVAPDLKVHLYAFIRECHDEWSHSISIQPVGFWSDVISVRKNKRLSYGKNGEWEPAEMSWGSGGTTGAFDSVKTTEFFIEALEFAKEWCIHIDKKFK